jgi:hypothetical protein
VLKWTTPGCGSTGGRAMIGDQNADDLNDNDGPLAIADRPIWSYWAKMNSGLRFHRFAYVETWDAVAEQTHQRIIKYRADPGTNTLDAFDNPVIYLGTEFNDWVWHYYEFDLEDDLQSLLPDEELVVVNGLRFDSAGISIDDMKLGTGRLEKSYALIPGAAIGGYLGVQSGEAGGDAGASTPAWSRWHHHYNDLGTVIAATDENGAKIGVYTPDFWGNYRDPIESQVDLDALLASLDGEFGALDAARGPSDSIYGAFGARGEARRALDGDGLLAGLSDEDRAALADLLRAHGYAKATFDPAPRPDTLGLDSKFFDAEAGLYYFGARWYDSERAVFSSKSPLPPGAEPRYNAFYQSPALLFDATGLWPDWLRPNKIFNWGVDKLLGPGTADAFWDIKPMDIGIGYDGRYNFTSATVGLNLEFISGIEVSGFLPIGWRGVSDHSGAYFVAGVSAPLKVCTSSHTFNAAGNMTPGADWSGVFKGVSATVPLPVPVPGVTAGPTVGTFGGGGWIGVSGGAGVGIGPGLPIDGEIVQYMPLWNP